MLAWMTLLSLGGQRIFRSAPEDIEFLLERFARGSAIRPKVMAAEHAVAKNARRISIRVGREDAKDRMLWRYFSAGADGIVSRHGYENMTFATALIGSTGVVAGVCLRTGLA